MIRNDILDRPIRAQILNVEIKETTQNNPFLYVALRCIDDQNNIINLQNENIAYLQFFVKKDGSINKYAIDLIKHAFPEWDMRLEWFSENLENLRYKWIMCTLHVFADEEKKLHYEAKEIYLQQVGPYRKTTDVKKLGIAWNAKIAAALNQK